jgi:hypothetical protein
MGVRWSDDAAGAGFYLGKSRSTSVGSIGSAVQAGDVLGNLFSAGDAGARILPGITLQAVASGNWSGSSGRNADFVLKHAIKAPRSTG